MDHPTKAGMEATMVARIRDGIREAIMVGPTKAGIMEAIMADPIRGGIIIDALSLYYALLLYYFYLLCYISMYVHVVWVSNLLINRLDLIV